MCAIQKSFLGSAAPLRTVPHLLNPPSADKSDFEKTGPAPSPKNYSLESTTNEDPLFTYRIFRAARNVG
jgi:hypothetical protein